MAAMRLTAWEEDRLLIFTAAELARRHRAAGLLLNAPEAVALICDAMLEAARAGADYAAVESAGRSAIAPREVMPGVRELIDDVRLEVLFGDGARLIVLVDPLGVDGAPADDGPGTIRQDREVATADRAAAASDDDTLELLVRSESSRLIRVSSHYPFHRVNRRLVFDREAARGFRLNLPAGTSERWAPGEARTVRLVRYRGEGGEAPG
jgi:urease subunit gamma/beta